MPNQKGVTLWFTGLSGSGKTTIAKEVERILKKQGYKVERLDGDEVRENLCCFVSPFITRNYKMANIVLI